MNKYKALHKQRFVNGRFSIVPIRSEDRYAIMKWRNEQMYHLRQHTLLTIETQDYYFETIVNALFDNPQPPQILFSYLDGGKCIGYGGLVHINWIDKNAEISFIMNTDLEKDYFHANWHHYLSLIEEVAFQELSLHKIFTYAFDLRPHLYEALENASYTREATLKEHCLFDGQYRDVIIHSKKNNVSQINFRHFQESDCDILYKWANEKSVRNVSFNSNKIDYTSHKQWFAKKIKDPSCFILVFFQDNSPIGQVRIEENGKHPIIGISIDQQFRGKGLGKLMIKNALSDFWTRSNNDVYAYIKPDNLPSIKSFENVGFEFQNNTEIDGCKALEYKIKKAHV